MAPSTSDTHDQRWVTISCLTAFGWSAAKIAHAAGMSEGTVRADIKSRGGATTLFPERPTKPREIFAATFKAIARRQISDPATLTAASALLDIRQLEDATAFFNDVIAVLCRPVVNIAMLGYMNLFTALRGFPWKIDRAVPYLDQYLHAVANGSFTAPGNSDEAYIGLLQHFAATCERGPILLRAHEGIVRVVNGWLQDDGTSPLATKERIVIRRRFGLMGQETATLAAIAAELKLTAGQVGLLERKALGKLRRQPYLEALDNCFVDMHMLHQDVQDLRQKSAQLRYENAQLRRLQHRLVTTIRDNGDVDAVLAEIDERQVWIHRDNPWLPTRVSGLELSPRVMLSLELTGLETIGQVVQVPEWALFASRNFGRKSINDLKEVLAGIDPVLVIGGKLEPAAAAQYPLPQRIQEILANGPPSCPL